MIKALWIFLFGMCDHKWKTVNVLDSKEYVSWSDKPVAIYKTYVQECEHCGVLKTKKIKL